MPTLQEAEAARNTLDVDVDQQLLGKCTGANSLPDGPLPDVSIANAPLPESCPDGSVGEGWTSPHVPEEEKGVVFRLGSGSCLVQFLSSNLLISVIDYYKCREVFGLLRVYSIGGFCVGFIVFIVLWDIVHAAFVQLLACRKPPWDGVEVQWVSWKYRELAHPAAQAQHPHSSHSTVYTPLLACHRQCQRRPLSFALNFDAESSSPQTAGDLTISTYTILNTFKLHTRRIWVFAARPKALNKPSVVNSTLTMTQLTTSMCFSSLNRLKT